MCTVHCSGCLSYHASPPPTTHTPAMHAPCEQNDRFVKTTVAECKYEVKEKQLPATDAKFFLIINNPRCKSDEWCVGCAPTSHNRYVTIHRRGTDQEKQTPVSDVSGTIYTCEWFVSVFVISGQNWKP